MFEKFEALNDGKQKNIINAAMKEFVKGGYEKASMNDVVESAGISKGSLFYYFGNKKKLYLYLFEYCESMILDNAHRQLDDCNSDFLDRMEQAMEHNIRLLSEYPLVYRFVKGCKTEKSDKVALEILRIKAERSEELFSKMYKNIDESLFKEDIDIQMAIFSVRATMFQIIHDAMRKESLVTEELISKLKQCGIFFRTCLYKK